MPESLNPDVMETIADPFVYSIARITLGLLFFFQGYDKIVRMGLANVYLEVSEGTSKKGIPKWFSRVSVFASSYIELTGGFLLVFGLFTLPALFVLAIHLVAVVAAFGYLQGIWDMKHVFPRLALILFLLLLPAEWNRWALDGFLF